MEKERDQFAMKFLEYASGLAISNFKSGGTWYLSDGTFVKTEKILEQFKALESSPTEQPDLLDKLKEKSKQLDQEAKSHRVTNSEQLKVNAGTGQPEAQKEDNNDFFKPARHHD